MNKGVDDEDKVPEVQTLYDHYVDWDIIDNEEKDGGWANSLRAAMVYDTRDRITNPMRGIWSDLTIRYSPGFLGNYHSALQLAFTHRQYITLIRKRLSFAYRLRYDACFGKLPFYTRQVLADGTEGFGGIGTLWGIHQNRIMARQFAMANFELRAKLFRFRFIQQNWYLAAVPLFHTGYLIEPIDMDLSRLTPEERDTYFDDTDQRWYSAYGIGGKLVMNENTVIGFDWAHSVNKGAGNDAVYIGFGYTF
jgi:outer membrane protein assembly factor BamA